MLQCPGKLVICLHIQIFNFLTLHIYCSGITKYIHQACLINFYVHPFCSKTYISQQAAKFTCSTGKISQLLNSKLIKRKNLPVDDIHNKKIKLKRAKIQDTGYKIQDTRCRIQDAGYKIQDTH